MRNSHALLACAVLAAACGGGAEESREFGKVRGVPAAGGELARRGDVEIARAMEQRLARVGEALAAEVEVRVEGGIATLSGEVPHLAALREAHAVASRTRGVRGIIDDLAIRPSARSDEEISAAVERAFELHPATHGLDLRAVARDAEVTISGAVASTTEHQLVEAIAAGVEGVRVVANDVQIEPASDLSDREIETDVESIFAHDVRFEGTAVDVEVRDGVVFLRGTVGSEDELSSARSLARVAGARAIDATALRVASEAPGARPPAGPITDADVENAIRDALRIDPRVPEGAIQVHVAAGIATLSGTVPTVAAERAALEDALNTIGAWRARDALRVVPRVTVSDDELTSRVRDVLASSPWVNASEIQIEAEDGGVRLIGGTRTPFARTEAERAIAAVEGVTAIDNRLTVMREGAPMPDHAIAAEVRRGLYWNPWVDAQDVQVEVERGVATLRGVVPNQRALREAEREAQDAGAMLVLNALELADRRVPEYRPPAIAPQPERASPR